MDSKNSKLHEHTNIDKVFYKTLFGKLFSDTCTVEYWDGEEETYGAGESQFRLVMKEPIPKADFLADPSMALGEAYMNEKVRGCRRLGSGH